MSQRLEPTQAIEMDTNQVPPKLYSDFSPVGKRGMKFHLSPDDVDPTNTESRREHMHAYFDYMVPGVDQRVYDELRQEAVGRVCDWATDTKHEAIRTSFFDYLVDMIFWKIWFDKHELQGSIIPDWPWSKCKPKISQNMEVPSVVYEEFLKDKATRERGHADSDSDSDSSSDSSSSSDSDTIKTGTSNANTADAVVASTRTVSTVVGYPNATENSDAVPDGMTAETFNFTFTAGSENAFARIAGRVAALSHNRRVEVTMRYTARRPLPGEPSALWRPYAPYEYDDYEGGFH